MGLHGGVRAIGWYCVANGSRGVDIPSLDSEAEVTQARTYGVKVVACENTRRNQTLNREDMQGGIRYAGAREVEIMTRQQEGWVYLRP